MIHRAASAFRGRRSLFVPLLAALALGLSAVGEESAEPAPARSVRLVTWNLENLFDETDDPDRDDLTPGARAVAGKLANLASVLGDLGGDTPVEILAVQEIETTDLLRRLGRLVHGEAPFTALVGHGEDGRGMGVGLLTTWRVLAHRAVLDGEPGSRPILVARLAPPGRVAPDLHVLVVHWKSMRPVEGQGALDDDRRRLRQARFTRGLVDEIRRRTPTARIVVAGDFNSEVGSVALGSGLGAAADENGVRASPGEALFDALCRISPSARGTTHWSFNAPPAWRAWATLDHVLLSASLLGDGPLRFDPAGGPRGRGATVHQFARQPVKFRAPRDVEEGEGPVTADLSSGVSDHFPVAVWLRLSPD